MRWLVLVGGVTLLLWYGAAFGQATATPAPTPRDTETPDASARGAARTPVALSVPVLVPAELKPDAPIPQ